MRQQRITQQENLIDYHPVMRKLREQIKFVVSCTALQELVELYNLLNSTIYLTVMAALPSTTIFKR